MGFYCSNFQVVFTKEMAFFVCEVVQTMPSGRENTIGKFFIKKIKILPKTKWNGQNITLGAEKISSGSKPVLRIYIPLLYFCECQKYS